MKTAQLLLEQGAAENARRRNQSTSALCAAVKMGHLEMVNLLLAFSADANSAVGNDDDKTPMLFLGLECPDGNDGIIRVWW